MPTPQATAQSRKDNGRAKLLLLILGVVWGLNWPAVKVSLSGVSPWTLRTIGLGAAACTLFVLALVRGRALRIGARDRVHIVMTGLLNIALFNILLTFAQLGAATSRVAIITYSMPLWATLFARIALGEKLDRVRGMGLALGAGGLAVLISPLLGGGLQALPHGILYALAAALTWAAGTVYMKWAKINAEPLAIAAWQLLIGALVALTGLLSFEGWPHPGALHVQVIGALAYHIFFGMAAGYILWFEIIARLPAGIAALGTLLVPVVGVSGAVLLLGERPSAPDMLGFVLIFSAAICVLLPAGSLRLLCRT
ncbi:DMT family transporter [Herbaspirillum rhizosphaerae]|uniref:DMT family transporter n=1 Tax=Herbaspirillum rhizosphaerae TaxID=346179 RepID=UPI000AF05230|nr:DMT family transporter [Herbaspirillum rhizosphaerae]